jgi:hypothetical protein
MSTTDPGRPPPTVGEYQEQERPAFAYAQQGDTWVVFAGTILAVLGTLNIIDGIAAVSKSKFFVGEAKFVITDLKTLGWVVLILGAAQLTTAAGVWLRWTGIRWVGVAIASLNAIAQLLVMPAYPLWAISLFALDILVIYALIAYGGHRRA